MNNFPKIILLFSIIQILACTEEWKTHEAKPQTKTPKQSLSGKIQNHLSGNLKKSFRVSGAITNPNIHFSGATSSPHISGG